MDAALYYASDGYKTQGRNIMGRHAAGEGFLHGYLRHTQSKTVTAIVPDSQAAHDFLNLIRENYPQHQARIISPLDLSTLSSMGCAYYPEPIRPASAWTRAMVSPQAYSLCGVTHTICTSAAMENITQLLTCPIQPWDALICTSQAVKTSINRMWDVQEEYLQSQHGAKNLRRPMMPVIPLGVDCEALAPSTDLRIKARRQLNIADTAMVVIFLGRLAFHAKANPAPMYIALQRLSQQYDITLIECGWTGNDFMANALVQARPTLCPSVRVIELDGRTAENCTLTRHAADVYCSLVDNVQETFGLSPVEAMASGLPCVVSDWNGYKDTVRDNIDGFRIPTLIPPDGSGAIMALAYANRMLPYDKYLSRISMMTVVDIDKTEQAFSALFADAGLRQRMGTSARQRARERFDWKTVISSYQDLWHEMAQIRSHIQQPQAHRLYPSHLDPFDAFANYTTHTLTAQSKLFLLQKEPWAEILDLDISSFGEPTSVRDRMFEKLNHTISSSAISVRDLLQQFAPQEKRDAIRYILAAAKLGLIRIEPV